MDKAKERDHDPVHAPRHYTQGTVECIEAIESALGSDGFIAFLRGQVIKYNWRLGMKGPALQDASKANWYGRLLEQKLAEQSQGCQGLAWHCGAGLHHLQLVGSAD